MMFLLLKKSNAFPSVDVILLKSLATSVVQPQSRKMKKYTRGDRERSERRAQDDLWQKQKRMNPFVRNVGMARQQVKRLGGGER